MSTRIRHARLMKAVDGINAAYGAGTTHFGDLGNLRVIKPRWSMRAGMMSPRFTTKWDELPRPHSRIHVCSP